MSKLKEKLKELGYYESNKAPGFFEKSKLHSIYCIIIKCELTYPGYNPIKIEDYNFQIYGNYNVSKEKLLEALDAFETMQKDVEVLKQCQD